MLSRKQKLLLMKLSVCSLWLEGITFRLLSSAVPLCLILAPEKGTLANLLDLNLFYSY
jgi:hypothetical protein